MHHAGNRAQREDAYDGLDASISEWNTFAGHTEELDSQGCSVEASFSQLDHPWIWLECIDFVDACWLVMLKVRPGTHANLQHGTLCLTQQFSPAMPDWCWVAQSVHESWINLVSVERHAATNSTSSRFDDFCCGSPITQTHHDESVNDDADIEVVEAGAISQATHSDPYGVAKYQSARYRSSCSNVRLADRKAM
jgi:hypothetical protein